MSLFDIDWNNDGKIDFQDTLYDMALVDDDEHQTSSSDYSDDDIYDTDTLYYQTKPTHQVQILFQISPVGSIMFLMNH